MEQTGIHTTLIKSSTFLVTGGAGFIGSNIVETLITMGAKHIRILDDLSNGHKKNIEPFLSLPNIEFIEGDIRDLDTCLRACKDIDYVLHQAALGSVPRSINNPLNTNSVNINGFLNMLEAVRFSGVKRMVYAASSSTYGDSMVLPKVEDVIGKPLSPYAVTKYVNELYAHVYYLNYGVETIGLRYFNVFGPKQDPKGAYAAAIPLFMQSVLDGIPGSIHGDGEQTRDFTFVANAVQANILAVLTTNAGAINQVFNIAAGNQTTVNGLWGLLTQFAGKSIAPLYKEARKGDVLYSIASIQKAQDLLNYNPSVSFRDGLKITFDWFIGNQAFLQSK